MLAKSVKRERLDYYNAQRQQRYEDARDTEPETVAAFEQRAFEQRPK